MSVIAQVRPVMTRKLELNSGLLCGWHEINEVNHDLPPPRVHISRMLDPEAELGLDPGTLAWYAGISVFLNHCDKCLGLEILINTF